MRTTDVAVIILHPEAAPDAGPLTRVLADARARLADRHARLATRAGATSVRIVAGPPDGRSFGARLRGATTDLADGGLVVMGSGAAPLATVTDHRAFIEAAAGEEPRALANNRFSADIVAIAGARDTLVRLPDLPSDNALPRWLAKAAGIPVADLSRRWRLAIDLDGPLDLVLVGGQAAGSLAAADRARVDERLAGIRAVAGDPRAELLIAGRTSAGSLRHLERSTASRTRAFIEERGLRTAMPDQRAPTSLLGMLLDRDGPDSLGSLLARLGDGAIIDTRVLFAHRLGAGEARWPSPEDRFAADLLLHERIGDPWLRAVTRSATEAPIPILLGGHSVVGPGLRLIIPGRH